METIICDITAFNYWRIPPIVQLLLAGDETNPMLLRLFSEEELLSVRQAMAGSSLCAAMLQPGPSTRNLGADAKALRPMLPILAANHSGPLDILVANPAKRHSSSILRTHLSSNDQPPGATTAIDEYVHVTNPPHTLLQLAGRVSLAKTIMLATELCGSFTIFKAPLPIKTALNKIARTRTFPKIGGWQPCLDSAGNLTDLWSRPALATPQKLLSVSCEASPRKGCKRLQVAANLTVSGAASPFEARTGILLGLPRNRGGEGHIGFSFNKKINLTDKARALAQRHHCICDLYWNEGLDVECQSALVHDNVASFLSDSDRTTALKHMGIDVLPITYGQLKSEAQFTAFSETVARIRGKRYRQKTAQQIAAEHSLRAEVFTDWSSLHLV